MAQSSSRSSKPLQWFAGLFGRRTAGDAADDGRPGEHRGAAMNTVTGRQLRQAHTELLSLLDAHPDTRQLFRHLHYVERALTRFGSRALERVPGKVLSIALEQLDGLIGPAPTEGLAVLRVHIQAGLLAKGVPTQRRRVVVDHDDGDLSDGLQVTEATPSLFDEMERSWTGQVPFMPTLSPDGERQGPRTVPSAS